MRFAWNKWTLMGAFVLWGAAIVYGSLYGLNYSYTPAPSESACRVWPAGSSCALSAQRPTLVMFVHPRCPCSRSSLHELSTLMTRCQGQIDARVLLVKPPSVPEGWVRTDLWDSAARIPGVSLTVDDDGIEQRRFRATASGETFVYLPNGQLLFHGGITLGRGHAGDNAGRAAVEAYVLHNELPTQTTPVFGCELTTPDSAQHAR